MLPVYEIDRNAAYNVVFRRLSAFCIQANNE